jgi:hypothetical protein
VTDKPKTGWEKYQHGLSIFTTLVGIAGIIYAFTTFIDYRIKTVVQDENYVRRIAAEVRPSVIFNGNGVILVDQGAMRYLNAVKILDYQPEQPWTNVPLRILVSPKQFLSFAPLLTPLDPTVSGSDVERTNQFDFVYTIGTGMMSTWVPPAPPPFPKFRLEILQ